MNYCIFELYFITFLIVELENVTFPLVFTDNLKADPVITGWKHSTFRETCQNNFKKGSKWKKWKNGRKQGYTPCPPELMKERNAN